MILTAILSVLSLLAFPALASAVTQVSVVPVSEVGNVVVANDDDNDLRAVSAQEPACQSAEHQP
jgi:hypothetical protein